MANVYGITDPSGTNSRGDFAPLPRGFEHVGQIAEDIQMKDETDQGTRGSTDSGEQAFYQWQLLLLFTDALDASHRRCRILPSHRHAATVFLTTVSHRPEQRGRWHR